MCAKFKNIKALTFDTGGTVLDWHTGFKKAFSLVGKKYNYSQDWSFLANELRRRSLKAMLNLGKNKIPEYNFDDAHEFSLKEIVKEYNLEKFNEEDIFNISYNTPHSFKCWEDFPRNLIEFKKQFITVSFTILSYKIIIDNAKYNNISWDAIFSCEGIGKYKILPEAYLSVAKYLQFNVSECMMVACHNFDLDAAKKVGFQTAFVKRVDEWGEEGPPDPNPNSNHDIIVENFDELKDILKK